MNNNNESTRLKFYSSEPTSSVKIIELKNNNLVAVDPEMKLVNDIKLLNKSLEDLQIEKEDLNLRLLHQYRELKKSEKLLKKDIHKALEVIMFAISHRVRLPLTNIIGLANLLTNTSNTNEENLEFIELIKEAASDLDQITKELGVFIYEIDSKNTPK